MIGNIRELRKSTLSETYLSVEGLFAENCGRLVDGRLNNGWDAFDQSLRLIIVDKHHNFEELGRILFECNYGVIRRAVKCKWFFASTPVSFFTEELLPVVSVSTRLKVISVLSKTRNETDAVCIFQWVRKEFGLRVAEPLLVSCPNVFIENIVLTDLRPISERTFAAIIKKSPELGVKIAAHWIKLKRNVPYSISKRLSLYPALFTNWEKNDLLKLHLKIGRKLLRNWKNRIETLGPKSLKYLKEPEKKRFFMSLEHENRVKFLKEMTLQYTNASRITYKTWQQTVLSFKPILKIEARYRDQLLFDSFQKIFSQDLWNAEKVLSPEILELVSKNQRKSLMELFQFNPAEYLYLSPANEAIPLMIQQIKSCADSGERSRLITAMVKTCIVSWDLKRLDDVISYVDFSSTLRLLNSNLPLRFLSTEILFKLTEIGHKAAKRLQFSHNLMLIHENYVTKLLERNQSVDEAFQLWMDDFVGMWLNYSWNPPMIRQPNAKIFQIFYKHLPEILEKLRENRVSQFIEEVLDTAKRFRIRYLEDGGKLLLSYVNGETINGIQRILKNSEACDIITNHCFLSELLKTRPKFVKENIEEIVHQLLICWKMDKRFLRKKHLLAFYHLDSDIARICETLQDLEDVDQKSRLLLIYSFVTDIENFKKFGGDYLAGSSKIDPLDKNAYVLIRSPTYLKHLEPVIGLFPLVRGYLIGGGDLFYPALGTFHKACFNSPMEKCMREVLPLLEAPIAVYIKAVAILSHVCTKSTAFEILKTDVVLKKPVVFKRLLSLFFDDPDENSWKILEEMIINSDKEFLDIVTLSLIPDQYLEKYAQIVWGKLEKSEMGKFLCDLKDRVNVLSEKFCREIIKGTVFQFEFGNAFTIRFLAYGPGFLEEKLSFVLSMSRGHVSNTFKFFSAVANEDSLVIQRFLTEFLKYFEKDLNQLENFKPMFRLFLLSLKQKHRNLEWIGKEISDEMRKDIDFRMVFPKEQVTLLKKEFPDRIELVHVVRGMICDDHWVNYKALLALDDVDMFASTHFNDSEINIQKYLNTLL